MYASYYLPNSAIPKNTAGMVFTLTFVLGGTLQKSLSSNELIYIINKPFKFFFETLCGSNH